MAKRTATKSKRGKTAAKAKAAPSNKKAARRAGKPAPRRAAARRRKKAAAPPDQEAMMAAWQQVMTPGEGHRRLEPMVGSFNTKTTFVMDQKAPPSVSDGVSEHRWVLGGRYLEQRYNGSMTGMPFEGLGYTAYDNAQKKYVGTWMDTFGTGIMNSISVGKAKDDEMDSEADAVDPSGKKVRFWCKLRVQDPDHHTYEMWTKGPNGRKYRVMLVEYARQ